MSIISLIVTYCSKSGACMLVVKEITSYPRGTINKLLTKSYESFHSKYPEYEAENFVSFNKCDTFFYDNPDIGNSCAFITEYRHTLCGMCCWDPRNHPDGIIGHNCISPDFKGIGLGKEQLSIAVNTLRNRKFHKLIVSTGIFDFFIPAQRMYQSVGFKEMYRETLETKSSRNCPQIYYELVF